MLSLAIFLTSEINKTPAMEIMAGVLNTLYASFFSGTIFLRQAMNTITPIMNGKK